MSLNEKKSTAKDLYGSYRFVFIRFNLKKLLVLLCYNTVITAKTYMSNHWC